MGGLDAGVSPADHHDVEIHWAHCGDYNTAGAEGAGQVRIVSSHRPFRA